MDIPSGPMACRIVSEVFSGGSTHWMSVIQWCIDRVAKVTGVYEAAKVPMIRTDDDLRIGGVSIEDYDAQTFQMIIDKVKERAAYQAALRAQGVDLGPN